MVEFMFLGVNGSCQETDGGNTSLLIRGGDGCLCVDLSCHLAEAVAAEPEAVVLTHEHIDHVYGLPSFLHQSWLSGRKKPLKIYVPQGMTELPEGLLNLFGLREKKDMFSILISEEPAFAVGELSVRTFPTDHTATSVGVAVTDGAQTLVYTSDTRPIQLLPCRPDVLIHEASGAEADEAVLIKKGHSSGADAGRLAAQFAPRRLFLCHLPREGKAAILDEARRCFPQTSLPELLIWHNA